MLSCSLTMQPAASMKRPAARKPRQPGISTLQERQPAVHPPASPEHETRVHPTFDADETSRARYRFVQSERRRDSIAMSRFLRVLVNVT